MRLTRVPQDVWGMCLLEISESCEFYCAVCTEVDCGH